MDIKQQKELCRTRIRERIAAYPEHLRRAEGRSICRQILKKIPAEVKTIAAYFPLQNEADTRLLLSELLKRGYQLYLPRFFQNSLTFVRALTLDNMIIGGVKIPEPPLDAALLNPAELDLMIVPARAYDRKGNRLGRGNGGYDFWINRQRKEHPKTKFWGIALECQILDDVPMEGHDSKVDAVVTARDFFVCP